MAPISLNYFAVFLCNLKQLLLFFTLPFGILFFNFQPFFYKIIIFFYFIERFDCVQYKKERGGSAYFDGIAMGELLPDFPRRASPTCGVRIMPLSMPMMNPRILDMLERNLVVSARPDDGT